MKLTRTHLLALLVGVFSIAESKTMVLDTIPPVIHLNTTDTLYHPVNQPYVRVMASVTDNVSDSSEISLTFTSNVNPFQIGTYKDEYNATDQSGNTTKRIRYVKVYDNEGPVISSSVGPVLKLGLYSNPRLSDYLVFRDNYDNPSIMKSNLEVLENTVNFYAEGNYYATFLTHDNQDNYSDTFTLYVVIEGNFPTVSISTLETSINAPYPNPSNGIITLPLRLNTKAYTIVVQNSMGKQILMLFKPQSTQLNLTHLPKGLYLLRCSSESEVFEYKIILQ